MIDVRDTAAHHVAAYEKGVEGRFFSTTEAWHWTLIYKALELYCPHIKDWPKPLPRGTKPLPVREYSKTRMNVLGVKQRSMLKLLGDAVKELELKKLFTGLSTYLDVGGYYELSSGNGKFLFIDNTVHVDSSGFRVIIPRISYVIGNMTKPAVYELPNGTLRGNGTGDFKLSLNEPSKPVLELNFQQMSEGSQIGVKGSIDGVEVAGYCFITSVLPYVYNGTYTTEDGSDTVTLAFGDVYNNSITFSDGSKVPEFDYDPIKRRFSYTAPNANGVDFVHRLYINVDAGCGLVIGLVKFDGNDPKNTGSKKYYNLKTKVTRTPTGPTNGAATLGTFAGYYPLADDGSTFLSIVGTDEDSEMKSSVSVGLCIDGTNVTQYSSFTFDNNKLTFPFPEAPTVSFCVSKIVSVGVNLPDGSTLAGTNSFSAATILAFGFFTLTTSPKVKNKGSLSLSTGNLKLTYTMNDAVIFDTIDYHYDPVQQAVMYDKYILNLCYNPTRGVTCGVTQKGGGFNDVLYAYP